MRIDMNNLKRESLKFGFVIALVLGVVLMHKATYFWGFVMLSMIGFVIANKCFEDIFYNKNCYRIRIRIEPLWEKIIGGVPEKYKDKPYRFWNAILNDKELGIDKEGSLITKDMRYTVFIVELNGMRQIYSHAEQCFIDEIEEVGRIIDCENEDKLKEKYGITEQQARKELEIRPGGIGISTRDPILPWFSHVDKGGYLSYIPIDSIIDHLKKLDLAWGSCMNKILKFPKELREYFEEHNIKYLTRDFLDVEGESYDIEPKEDKIHKYAGFEFIWSTMNFHTFSTEYFNVSVNLKRIKKDETWEF